MDRSAGGRVSGIAPAEVGLFTNLYELTMAASYFREGMHAPATFSLFIRSYPPTRKFYVAAGLAGALAYLEKLSFPPPAIDYIRATKLFQGDFLGFLAALKFTGDAWAIPEGRAVFANEPLLEITAPVIEAQLAETFLINVVGYQTLIAAKAARAVLAADDPQYQRRYEGDAVRRDHAYHQGTVWPWLLGPFVDAWLRTRGDRAGAVVLLAAFPAHFSEAGLGTISEIAGAEAPHAPRGCIAQAWSVAEVLRA